MKVTIKYTIEVEKEIEMNCEDYCHLHADFNYLNLFPNNAINKDVHPSTEKDEEILTNYFFDKN